MANRQRLGKFILLEEVDTTALGSEYRAAKLGPAGLERIVSLVRVNPALCTDAEVPKSLLDQVKAAAQIQNPNVVRISGIGRVEAAYYISYEFLESKSLKAIFKRCRQEAFPFSVDHALLIASKACSALEQAHAKSEPGSRYLRPSSPPQRDRHLRGGGRASTADGPRGDGVTGSTRLEQPRGHGHPPDTFAGGAALRDAHRQLLLPTAARDPAAKVGQGQWEPGQR